MNEEMNLKFLDKFNQLSLNRGNLIQLVNGSFLTVFLAFFTMTLNSRFDSRILIICISSVFFWRIYIHFIDNEIIQNYRRIVHCELNITGGVDEEISLQGSLNKQKSKPFYYKNRGQLLFDGLAFLIILGLTLDYYLPLLKNQFRIHTPVSLLLVISEIFIYCIFIISRYIADDYEIHQILAMKKQIKTTSN